MVAIYSQMLQRRYAAALDERGSQYLEYTIQGAKRMEMLVKDLLAYTQAASVQEGPLPLCDTRQVLEQALSNLHTSIEESGAVIEISELPVLRIAEVHLVQVFQNLIGNAIKYQKPGQRPEVRISGKAEGGAATICVKDNGIGIPEQYRKHVFGLFRRLHSWDKYSGTGIGLAICLRIVERYGGKIWVDSREGNGSEFCFTLPAE